MTTVAPGTAEPAVDAAPASPAPVAGDIIVMDDVTMRFGDVEAVRNLSLRVPRGTILGVIGPSGAGKTTTIRMLTGALFPTEGRVKVLGEDPHRFRRRTRERIGYMPQLFTLYPDLTAGENVDFVASLFGLLWRRRWERVEAVLKIVDLWDARGRRASDLSGGMQRRLELASALVHEPELLFLDEPTAGIDPLLRARIWEELHRLKAAGRTLIVTTQYVNEAEECDSVALIAQGRLAALAEPDELRRRATGGDVLELEIEGDFDAQRLTTVPGVRRVEKGTDGSLRVIVDDAGQGMPLVVDAIDDAGADVVVSREARLTFDEVFTELVERNRRELEAEERGEAGDDREAVEAPPATEGVPEWRPTTTAADADGHDHGDVTSDDPGDARDPDPADAAAALAATDVLPGASAPLTTDERVAAEERARLDRPDEDTDAARPLPPAPRDPEPRQ